MGKLWLGVALIACLLAGAWPRVATAARPAKKDHPKATESGLASWFKTHRSLTAAHRTLPLGSKVTVVAKNGRSVVVTIRDRGPTVRGRVIDLSSDAFKKLASLGTGIIHVRLKPVPPAAPGRLPAKSQTSKAKNASGGGH